MTMDALPPRPALLHPEAGPYAERVLELSRSVQAHAGHVPDIPYGDDYWQKLDVYLPSEVTEGPVPVLMFLHGGAWTCGYKEWMGFMAPLFIDLPAIFISVSYRLSPESRFPDALWDTQDALSWVWRNIGVHGGDPDRIALGGHSAGGHLAALTALDSEGLVRRGLPADVVKACLPVSAPFDLRAPPQQRDAGQQRAYRDFLAREEDDAEASPILRVRPVATRFLVAWGGDDFPRIRAQGPLMVDALSHAGVETSWIELQGSSHFDTSLQCMQPGHAWTRAARELLSSMHSPLKPGEEVRGSPSAPAHRNTEQT